MKKFLVLLLLGVPAVVAGLIALGSAPAQAAPAVHCVPDASIDVSCTDGHATIQAAIDHAAIGDTVLVGTGTYTATSLASIVITTNGLSLVGQSRDGTIIDGGAWGSSGTGWPRGIQVYADDVTIRDLTVRGFTGDLVNTGGYGIVFRDWAHDTAGEGYIFYSGGLVDNVKLEDNYSSMYALCLSTQNSATVMMKNGATPRSWPSAFCVGSP